MSFLIDLNESLNKDSQLIITVRKGKAYVVFKVLDSDKHPLKNAELFIKEKFLGVTNDNGELRVEAHNLPRKGVIKAVVGIYHSKKQFKL